jgi:hypothetical protein
MDCEKEHLFHFYPKIVDCVSKWVVEKLGLRNNVIDCRHGQTAALQLVFETLGPFCHLKETLQKSN